MADSGGLVELVIKAREHAKITERGILKAEYEELSSKMAHLETQISENLENQTKLNKGEDENGNSG
jgi:hypothetical protein